MAPSAWVATASSIAETASSGLSAGSIYSHFSSKAELFRHVAAELLEDRATSIGDAARTAGRMVTPREIFLNYAPKLPIMNVPQVLLQVWAEVLNDPELRQLMAGNLALLEQHLTELLLPWGEAKYGEEAPQRVAVEIEALLTTAQGIIVRSALLPGADVGALHQRLAPRFDAE